VNEGEADLRAVLEMLDPATPESLRHVLIHKPTVTRSPLSCSATVTDMATTGRHHRHPDDASGAAAQLLGEIEAS